MRPETVVKRRLEIEGRINYLEKRVQTQRRRLLKLQDNCPHEWQRFSNMNSEIEEQCKLCRKMSR